MSFVPELVLTVGDTKVYTTESGQKLLEEMARQMAIPVNTDIDEIWEQERIEEEKRRQNNIKLQYGDLPDLDDF